MRYGHGPRHKRALISALLIAVSLGILLVTALVSCSRRPPGKPNVVLVVVDALRRDYVGCYGCDRPTTPRIDALAASGITFETCVAHAPWTKPSFSSMFTSLYPFQHGVVDWDSAIPDTLVTLAEVLKGHGYSTAAVINMLGIAEEFRIAKGIDEISAADKRERDAAATTKDAIDLIKKAPRPFFIVVHYFDVHWPNLPSPEYVALVEKPSDPDPFVARGVGFDPEGGRPEQGYIDREVLLYAASVRYADRAVGDLLDFLDQSRLREGTLVIVTADHGEAFWEHGAGSHGGNLYDEVLNVPLILSYPAKFTSPRRIKPQVRHVDLLPTIVELASARDNSHREGTSLCGLMAGKDRGRNRRALLPETLSLSETDLKKYRESKCLRSLDTKLITEAMTSLVELYDLRADPGETINLWAEPGGAGREPDRRRNEVRAVGDSLMAIMERVPGSNLNGWRISFTGASATSAFGAAVRVEGGGRLTVVEKMAGRGNFTLEVSSDSTAVSISTLSKGLQMFRFDVAPHDAAVTFEVSSKNGGAPAPVYVGREHVERVGRPLRLDPKGAHGLPTAYPALAQGDETGACVWWLPGQEVVRRGPKVKLTQEQKRRLRSLGYVQ